MRSARRPVGNASPTIGAASRVLSTGIAASSSSGCMVAVQVVAVGRNALLDRLTEVLPQMNRSAICKASGAPSAAPSA
ncbi:hypothetical protein ABZ568_06145 [Streptomyces olindensis]|uniref:Uncharacterized protein n=1 Tax=Streptomyces olindensis TaxID=358823 RepID=A0ABV2XPS5_9ACTN